MTIVLLMVAPIATATGPRTNGSPASVAGAEYIMEKGSIAAGAVDDLECDGSIGVTSGLWVSDSR